MLARSFRLVTARLIPRPCRCKQTLLLVLAAFILAGCGSSGEPKQSWRAVDGGTFRFRAPASWRVAVAKGGATARDGSDFVQVATFPLARAYTEGLFHQVQGELSRRMADAAQRAG